MHPRKGRPPGCLGIEFPWRITFGAVVTFAVAVCFKTPEFQVVAARKYVDRQSRIAP